MSHPFYKIVIGSPKDRILQNAFLVPVGIKYIDPSYIIRSVPANANDRVYCGLLGQQAVHAAMAGKTGMVVAKLMGRYVHLPLSLVTLKRQKLNIASDYWRSVLESTGQLGLKGMVPEAPCKTESGGARRQQGEGNPKTANSLGSPLPDPLAGPDLFDCLFFGVDIKRAGFAARFMPTRCRMDWNRTNIYTYTKLKPTGVNCRNQLWPSAGCILIFEQLTPVWLQLGIKPLWDNLSKSPHRPDRARRTP